MESSRAAAGCLSNGILDEDERRPWSPLLCMLAAVGDVEGLRMKSARPAVEVEAAAVAAAAAVVVMYGVRMNYEQHCAPV